MRRNTVTSDGIHESIASAQLVMWAFAGGTVWLLGDATYGWLKWGFWATYSLLSVAHEMGATEWASAPNDWIGLHKILAAFPLWVATGAGALCASAVVGARRR